MDMMKFILKRIKHSGTEGNRCDNRTEEPYTKFLGLPVWIDPFTEIGSKLRIVCASDDKNMAYETSPVCKRYVGVDGIVIETKNTIWGFEII